MQFIPTILCGGAGSRLWPVSRDLHPKPFIKLNDGESLLKKTYSRAMALNDISEILTITNTELYFKTVNEFRQSCPTHLSGSFILEPFGRNTAPAIATAALYIAGKYGDDATLIILPADHLITNQEKFCEAVNKAKILATQGKIVTFGIQPNKPETGYGYIEIQNNQVSQFVEKPCYEKALEYLQSGNFFWNSGMFCFKAGTILHELERYNSETLTSVKYCLQKTEQKQTDNLNYLELPAKHFESVPDISIDFAIMEKTTNLAAVTCNIGWQDIGSWNTLSQLATTDEQNNSAIGKVILEDTQNCYIQSDSRVVGTVGIRDLLIVDTPDALLVAKKTHAQEVKKIYLRLKRENHEASYSHRTVYSPWGTYTILEEGSRFKIKRIVVNPSASLSLQMHYHRSEHWIVVSGTAKVINGEAEIFLKTNESTFIPANHLHRLENPGKLPLILIEVQSGEYLGEDDIVRFHDEYGRSTLKK